MRIFLNDQRGSLRACCSKGKIGIVKKLLSLPSSSECVEDKEREEDRLFEAFLLSKFGSIQSYAAKSLRPKIKIGCVKFSIRNWTY